MKIPETSEQLDQLWAALAQAQGEMQDASFNRVNPHFKSKYADLSSIREASKPLAKHGIAISFPMCPIDDQVFMFGVLAHKSDQRLVSMYPAPMIGTPQAMGSLMTYAKRYLWAALIAIASDDDDDGNAAQKGASDITLNPPQPLSKAKSRPLYEKLQQELRTFEDPDELYKWGLESAGLIHSMHLDFVKWLTKEFRERLAQLKGEDRETVAERLRASVEMEKELDDEIPDDRETR